MVYRERKHFLTFCQSSDETVTEWRERLQNAAIECKFGDHINAFLVTRFICGLASTELFEELSRRLKYPLDQWDAACHLVEECERDLKKQTANQSETRLNQTIVNDFEPVTITESIQTIVLQPPPMPAEEKLTRVTEILQRPDCLSWMEFNNNDIENNVNLSTTDMSEKDIDQSTISVTNAKNGATDNEGDRKDTIKSAMVRRVSRFSISPAEIPQNVFIKSNTQDAVHDDASMRIVSDPSITNVSDIKPVLCHENVSSSTTTDESSGKKCSTKTPEGRKMSRFSITPAEIPEEYSVVLESSALPVDSKLTSVVKVDVDPESLEYAQIFSSDSVSVVSINRESFLNTPTETAEDNSTESIIGSNPIFNAVPNSTMSTEISDFTESNMAVVSDNQTIDRIESIDMILSSELIVETKEKSVPSSLDSIPDIGSPTKKQNTLETPSAFEQFKIDLENITRAQVLPSLSKTSQSPADDMISFTMSPNIKKRPSRPSTPSYEIPSSCTTDGSLKSLLGPHVPSVFPNLIEITNNLDKSPKKHSRASCRFVRRKNSEAKSNKMQIPMVKSSYFDMDTIDMEYPRNLDSNIEMLGLEAEHMEEQFTVTKDDKLRSFGPINLTACTDDASKEMNVMKVLPTDKEDARLRDDDDPIGMSPCKRFFKYNKEVGFGSFKTVFRGLDTHTGVAVAWCELLGRKVKKSERLRFREEADMLKKLQNPNIVRFYDYWEIISGVDKRRNIVLVTELMLSGTLKSYLKRFKQINPKVFKSWCRQILKGLYFLHTRNPTIIHRDLKCDNIFITGTTGCVKIGDLGLATLKEGSFAKSIIGTPEFMAPEMYEEHYDEAVDIYAFGMCMLEMTTSEYPYNECNGPAQIYKKVANGIKPESFAKVTDERVKEIIVHCTQLKKEDRPNCKFLLNSEFFSDDIGLKLQPYNKESFLNNLDCNRIEFRLRLLDSKQRQFKHREDEAIQFEFELGVDNTDELASEMFHAEIIREEDSRTVAKLLKVQITSMLKERRELAAIKQQNLSTTTTVHTGTSPRYKFSELLTVSEPIQSNPNPCYSPIHNTCNDSPSTMSPACSPLLQSTPTYRENTPINRVMSPVKHNGEAPLLLNTPTRSKRSSRCDPMVPRLAVINTTGRMVECSMECMMKTITFKFDIEDVKPNDVASRLISQDLLDETQREVFAAMIADVVKTEHQHLGKDAGSQQPVMNGHHTSTSRIDESKCT